MPGNTFGRSPRNQSGRHLSLDGRNHNDKSQEKIILESLGGDRDSCLIILERNLVGPFPKQQGLSAQKIWW